MSFKLWLNLGFFSTLYLGNSSFAEFHQNSEAKFLVQCSETQDLFKAEKAFKQDFNILVLGGGYSPSGNQVSLESNIRYFERIKSKINLDASFTKTLFADGASSSRDLQYFDPNFIVPDPTLILAETFGSTRGIFNQYRNHNIETDGSASIEEVDQWIEEVNSSSNNNTNIIYFTGHGGKGDKKTPENTSAYLWNNQKLKVSDLSKKLDSLPITQSCILVMVQCYSGGFANVIFKEGDPKKGLADQTRAGFFATVHDRVAAGCTPDIREEDYREYSTRFWEALCGESRIGNKIQKPDYNLDGFTSLLEAHTYVILSSETIDLPIKTSDILLRKFIEIKTVKRAENSSPNLSPSTKAENKQPQKSALKNTIDKIDQILDQIVVKTKPSNNREGNTTSIPTEARLLADDPIQEILEFATYESRAIIDGLSKKLSLTHSNRYHETEKKIKDIKQHRESLLKEKKAKEAERKKVKGIIKKNLIEKWPELTNLLHPTTHFIQKKENSQRIFEIANENQNWSQVKKLKEEISTIEKKRFDLEKRQVFAMRLLRELENVALETALANTANPDLKAKFQKLRKLERTILKQ